MIKHDRGRRAPTYKCDTVQTATERRSMIRVGFWTPSDPGVDRPINPMTHEAVLNSKNLQDMQSQRLQMPYDQAEHVPPSPSIKARRCGISFRHGVRGLSDGSFKAVVIFLREVGDDTEEQMVVYPEAFATAAAARDHAYLEALKGRGFPY